MAYASLLDEGSAGAEAMATIARTVNSKTKHQFLVIQGVHTQTIHWMKQRAVHIGIELILAIITALILLQ